MPAEIKYPTKEEALAVVTQKGGNLRFYSKELKNDEDVVMAAIKQNSMSFRYASKALKSNKTFILKALHEGIDQEFIPLSNSKIKSDIEVMTLAVEKSENGWEFAYAQGEAALNKELAAKALVKWGVKWGASDLGLWKNLYPTLQEFFPRNSWYEKAQSYLNQLNQERQAELVAGGCTAEDEVVW